MVQLVCGNEFCIYQKKGTCILESITLDVQGTCLDCIYVRIEKDALNTLKEKSLNKL